MSALFDELYHFLAAQCWLAEGQLRIADGIYERTALFTIFLAQWLGLFGESLVVARLPSLIAGVALVVLVFLWTRTVAGNLAAVIAALLLALGPGERPDQPVYPFLRPARLLFWLGAVGAYRLVTSPPAAPWPGRYSRGMASDLFRDCAVSADHDLDRAPGRRCMVGRGAGPALACQVSSAARWSIAAGVPCSARRRSRF